MNRRVVKKTLQIYVYVMLIYLIVYTYGKLLSRKEMFRVGIVLFPVAVAHGKS